MPNGKPKTVRYTASEVEQAVRLYASGLSVRAVEKLTTIGASAVRKAVKARGLVRGRLEHCAPLSVRLQTGYDVAPNGCWVWRGRRNNMGYGMTSDGPKRLLAHRAMCELVGRPVPPGLDACHRCDNPACCNPDHIFFGTRAENMRDAAAKGRTTAGEKAPNAKLRTADVIAIREMAASGLRQAEISRRTGVGFRAVHAIVRRQRWTSVP